jgi:predicted phage terminase large subunit-like protein
LSTKAKAREAQERLRLLLEEKAVRAARQAVLPFVLYTMPQGYDANWHHRALAAKLDLFARGEIRNLLVTMPPQHGKSELVSRRLPAFLLGQNPRTKIVIASYSADLATGFNRDIQRIICSPEYKRLFPDTRISEKNVKTSAQGSFLRNQDIFEVISEGGKTGFVKTTGVGGSLTGTPVDVGIIDDPIKGSAEAHSKTFRDSVWEWYCSVFKTRLHNGSQTLLTLTRWHEDDLAGRILKSAEAGDWEILCLRGLREDEDNPEDPREVGDALWEGRHSRQRLLEAQQRNPAVFAALYQQRPAPPDGSIILPNWFGRFDAPPAGAQVLLSVDATFKGEGKGEIDFVAVQAWAAVGQKFYLLDAHRERAGFVRTLEILRALYRRHRAGGLLVEDKANGSAIVDVLKRELSGVIPIEPSGGKMARAFAAQPALEAGQVLIPAVAPWVEGFLQECREFPSGAHDDQIDAMTQAINYFVGRGSAAWAANLRF